MKVYVVEPFGNGGLLQYTHQLASGLSKNGVETTLFTGSNYELEHVERNFTVRKTWRLWAFGSKSVKPSEKPWALAKLSALASALYKAILWQREWIKFSFIALREKPDIILVGTIFTYPLLWFYLKIINLAGIKIAQVCHEFEMREVETDAFAYYIKKLNDRSYNFFDAIFFLSDNLRERFLQTFVEYPLNKTHVIPMGNAQMFVASHHMSPELLKESYGIDPDATVVLMFGRLTTDRGVSDLLDAFHILIDNDQMHQCHLLIAGPPVEDVDKWFKQIDSLKLLDRVILDPRYVPVEEVQPLIEMASVVVYPYWSASQSFSLQVAYSFGRPVVATNVGGLPEDVIDGKSGYIVESHAPDQLAKAIEKVLRDPDKAREMGEYAHHLSITKHSWESIGKQVATVFHEIMPPTTDPEV